MPLFLEMALFPISSKKMISKGGSKELFCSSESDLSCVED
jgi:hypothetical protein